MHADKKTTRRAFVVAAGGVGTVAWTGAAGRSAGAAGRPLDLLGDLPMIYRKLRYSASDAVVAWWFQGSKFGQHDAKFRPLYGVETCNWNRVKQLPDGGFSVTVLECAFYTDLGTGAILREFVNPYTNRKVQIPYAVVGPITARYSARSELIPLTDLGGSKIRMRTTNGPAVVLGDALWMKTSNDFQISPQGGGTIRQVNEWATYTASAAEVADPKVHTANPTVDLIEVTTWPRWLDMAGAPGAIMGQLSGRKVASLEAMPASFRQKLAEVFPAVARNPISALDQAPANLVH